MSGIRADSAEVPRLWPGTRIAIVLDVLDLSGAERQALHVARFLRHEADCQVEVIGLRQRGRVNELCETQGLACAALGLPGGYGRRLLPRQLWSTLRALRRFKADVVLPYTMLPNVLCGLLWKAAGAQTCIWNQRDEGRSRLYRPVERAAMAWTPWFASNSRHAAEFLQRDLGASPQRVRVIYNGVSLPAPQRAAGQWREELGARPSTLIACMVAKLDNFKDHLTLVEAWRLVDDRLRAAGRASLLVLAGRRGNTAPAIERRIAELNLQGRVRLLSEVKDISGLLAAADLGVFSSRLEGCPNGVLEAMAAGLPVVGTDIPGIREALGATSSDVFATAGDAAGLADRIVSLTGDAELRRRLGQANQRRVQETFALARMTQETADLIAAALRTAGR